MYNNLLPNIQLALALACLPTPYEDMIEIGTLWIKSTGVCIISHLKITNLNRLILGNVSMDGILIAPDIKFQSESVQAAEKNYSSSSRGLG